MKTEQVDKVLKIARIVAIVIILTGTHIIAFLLGQIIYILTN